MTGERSCPLIGQERAQFLYWRQSQYEDYITARRKVLAQAVNELLEA